MPGEKKTRYLGENSSLMKVTACYL